MGNIVHKSVVKNDNYVQFVYDKLDVTERSELKIEIPYNFEGLYSFDWNIGVICGSSGSGKSSILRAIGRGGSDDNINYIDASVISQFSQFGLTPQQASDILFNVGLSSIPTWLNNPHNLSNGERSRLDVALSIAKANNSDTIYIDEYTSVVNRDVAKSMSNSIQKYVRRKNKKIIFASCHFDILEWLKCDWIYNLNKRPCEIERIIYSDSMEYEHLKGVHKHSVLSNIFKI